MQPRSRQLSTAYSVCRGIARAAAKNFYYAFLVLPQPKRDALCAVYSFMRHADDLSDDPGLSPDERRQQLAAWAQSLHQAAANMAEGSAVPSDDPVVLALADAQALYSIPHEYFDQLVYGTALDLQFADLRFAGGAPAEASPAPYRTFEDLYQYCYHVASVVGLVCLHIFGYEDPAARLLAEQTGIAFQLTNIIRDVKEDAAMGRVYLPLEDLARFEISPQELVSQKQLQTQNNARIDPARFRPLLEFEASRARSYYAAAEALLPLIHADSRPCLWALVEIYRRLLDKIAARGYDVFSSKVRLSTAEKLSVLFQGFVKTGSMKAAVLKTGFMKTRLAKAVWK